ncbi:TPA: YitT family protein [Listeria monocytogenes]|nr:YitT family protein [Listeria monocytogenes]
MSSKIVYKEYAKKTAIAIIAALLNAIGMNFFLIPAQVYAAGLNGVAQLGSDMLRDSMNISISTGLLVLLLNIPVAILDWLKVGKSFTVFSFLTVAFMSFFLIVIPEVQVSNDILLNAIFGALIASVGIGLALKFGISTGGLDIVAMYITIKTGRSFGKYFLLLNGVIIIVAGFAYDWTFALYTLISLYVQSRVIDIIHTRHQKLTVMIMTQHSETVIKAIHENMVRGITVVDAMGGYSKEDVAMLIMVITRYELYDITHIVGEFDSKAFINVMETSSVFGDFRSEADQKLAMAMYKNKMM